MSNPTVSAQEQRRHQEFLTTWVVAEDYEICDGFVRPRGMRGQQYTLVGAEYDQLLGDFLKIATGGEKEIEVFVKRWGLLGYRELAASNGASRTTDEEPVAWIKAHAEGAMTCARLIEYLRGKDAAGLERFIASFPTERKPAEMAVGRTRVARKKTLLLPHAYGLWMPPVPYTVFDDTPVEYVAKAVVQQIVNDNLDTVHPRLGVTESGSELALYQAFTALLGVIYWQLAQLVVDAQRLGRCAYCGSYFLITHRKQRYCPPPSREGHTESLCSRKARARSARGGKDA